MPKVSVIVPVYNVENYMERCAVSLFEQTLDDIEYLFIDDCTPDHSIEILRATLERYPSRRERVRIISMASNSGLPAVRRCGISESTGDYIIHCDSDDWVDVTMYEKMYDAAIANAADVVMCDFYEEYRNKSKLYKNPQFPSDPKEVIANAYRYVFIGAVWNKLIKRDLYITNNIYPYENINMAEDLGVTCRIFVNAEKLYPLNEGLYHYNKANIRSISANKQTDKNLNDMLFMSELLRRYLSERVDCSRFELYANFLCYSSRLQIIQDNWEDWSRFKETYPETDKYVPFFSVKAFPPRAALRFWLVSHGMAYVSIALMKGLKFFSRLVG